jgi:hypothetical protein
MPLPFCPPLRVLVQLAAGARQDPLGRHNMRPTHERPTRQSRTVAVWQRDGIHATVLWHPPHPPRPQEIPTSSDFPARSARRRFSRGAGRQPALWVRRVRANDKRRDFCEGGQAILLRGVPVSPSHTHPALDPLAHIFGKPAVLALPPISLSLSLLVLSPFSLHPSSWRSRVAASASASTSSRATAIPKLRADTLTRILGHLDRCASAPSTSGNGPHELGECFVDWLPPCLHCDSSCPHLPTFTSKGGMQRNSEGPSPFAPHQPLQSTVHFHPINLIALASPLSLKITS